MPKPKAGRNKTIDTSLDEGAIYLERCLQLSPPSIPATDQARIPEPATPSTSTLFSSAGSVPAAPPASVPVANPASFAGPVLQLDQIMDKTILGDTLQVCPLLPPESMDLIIADPPYNLTKTFDSTTFSTRNNADYEAYTRTWLSAIKPLLKPDGSIYICCDWRTSLVIGRVLSDYFVIQNRITWQREKGRGAKRNWKNGMEDIWFATNGSSYHFDLDAVRQRRRVIAPYRVDGEPKDWQETSDGRFRDTCPSNFWDDITIPFWSMPENTAHPTQKPEKLIAKLVLASSAPGDLVFDPFLGSGTTSVVAKKLGRHYVGVEAEPRYCIWAEQRLEMAESDGTIQGYADGVFWERNSLHEQGRRSKCKK